MTDTLAETRPTTEAPQGMNKEREVRNNMSPAVARLLVGSASVDRERFNPDTHAPITEEEKSRLFQATPDKLAYGVAARVSEDSRGSVTESYDDWKQGLEAWLDKQKTSREGTIPRLASLESVGLISTRRGGG